MQGTRDLDVGIFPDTPEQLGCSCRLFAAQQVGSIRR